MRSITTPVVVVLLCITTAASGAPRTFAKRAGGPAVTFTAGAVNATTATPHARVHFAGVVLGGGNYELRVTKPAGSALADPEGKVSFAPHGGVETRAVWLVVDGTSGGYTVTAPHGMLLREIDEFPGEGVKHNPAGALRRILLGRHNVDVFLVRPGEGTWGGNLRDGGRSDQDGAMNGSIDGDLSALVPLGGSGPTPERIGAGDVLFLVDRNTLEFHVARLGR